MKEKRYSNVEVFQTWKLECNHLFIDWAKEKAKMAKIILHIYV